MLKHMDASCVAREEQAGARHTALGHRHRYYQSATRHRARGASSLRRRAGRMSAASRTDKKGIDAAMKAAAGEGADPDSELAPARYSSGRSRPDLQKLGVRLEVTEAMPQSYLGQPPGIVGIY